MIVIICVLNDITIIKSHIGIFGNCLGLRHETMLRALCLVIFLYRNTTILLKYGLTIMFKNHVMRTSYFCFLFSICTWIMGASNLRLILISSTWDCITFHSFNVKVEKKFKSWQICDWLAKWLIGLGFMDLRWPRVYRRSNVGLVWIYWDWG